MDKGTKKKNRAKLSHVSDSPMWTTAPIQNESFASDILLRLAALTETGRNKLTLIPTRHIVLHTSNSNDIVALEQKFDIRSIGSMEVRNDYDLVQNSDYKLLTDIDNIIVGGPGDLFTPLLALTLSVKRRIESLPRMVIITSLLLFEPTVIAVDRTPGELMRRASRLVKEVPPGTYEFWMNRYAIVVPEKKIPSLVAAGAVSIDNLLQHGIGQFTSVVVQNPTSKASFFALSQDVGWFLVQWLVSFRPKVVVTSQLALCVLLGYKPNQVISMVPTQVIHWWGTPIRKSDTSSLDFLNALVKDFVLEPAPDVTWFATLPVLPARHHDHLLTLYPESIRRVSSLLEFFAENVGELHYTGRNPS
jgi:hypothetical protein